MQWVILIIIGIVWVISKASEGASNVSASIEKKRTFNDERNRKYKERFIDPSKSLFQRNQDIISAFESKITNHDYRSYRSYTNYYIENETRDCINEICLAEGRMDIQPSSAYLSNWISSAPKEWVELARQIEQVFSNRKQKLSQLDSEISDVKKKLQSQKSNKESPSKVRKIAKRDFEKNVCIDEVEDILTPNNLTWSDKEKNIINYEGKYKKFPIFVNELDHSSISGLNREIDEYNEEQKRDVEAHKKNQTFFSELFEGYKKGLKDKFIERFDFVLNDIELPTSLPKMWEIDFDPEQFIAILEIKLPDIIHNEVYKNVKLKNGTVKKPLTQKEKRDLVPTIHPAIILRTAYEVFRNDISNKIKLLVVNGWVEFDNPATGLRTKTYTASLTVEKEQIITLNLSKLEPLSAFSALKGKSAGKLIDIIPVSPVMSLDRKDKRFIETKEVLSKMDTQTNLASMDWQDFENLIAELFQKEFSEEGTEIKLTQSSRDKGVDAIVFNPDPVRGGKYVIQAKRYTNTVDVSAVRDLVAVVAHEGASRGILVTTSTFGADAYAFVQNKPITLLDGSKLLGLLEKHGYKFRVNLAEARKLFPHNQKY